MENKRVLLIGANGYIGEKLSKSLILSGYTLITASRKTKKSRGVKVVQCDLLVKESIEKNFQAHQIDIVINAAAITGTMIHTKYQQNVQGLKNLIDVMEQFPCKKLIFFSSINVCMKEMGPYAKSKRACENILKKSSLEYLIIRPNIVYGVDNRNDFFFLSKIARSFNVLPVFGNPKKKIAPVYIEDLVAYTIERVKFFETHAIINIMGSEVISIQAAALCIKEALNKKIVIWNIPTSVLDLFSSVLPFDVKGIDEDRVIKDAVVLQSKESFRKNIFMMIKEFNK